MPTHIVRFSGVQGRIICAERIGPRFVLLLGGFPPGDPRTKHHPEIKQCLRRGYSVLAIDYPGVRESDGMFTPKAALRAAKSAVRLLRGGKSKNLWSGERLAWSCSAVVIVGVSFGGAIALAAAADTGVERVLAVSAVTDWSLPLGESDAQQKRILDRMNARTVRLGEGWNAFGAVDPSAEAARLSRIAVELVHARDDDIVPARHAREFAAATHARVTLLPTGGHLSASEVPARVWTRVLGAPASRR